MRSKGWVGQLVEDALGAVAGNRPVPDFERLGVELKTVPVDGRGRPRESTYVTALSLEELQSKPFLQSNLRKKLDHVLFVPVEATPSLPMPVRRLGTPMIWRPSPEEVTALAGDWRDFQDRVAAAGVDSVGPQVGSILQIRPKGADAKDTQHTVTRDGTPIRIMRRGLYLRPRFVLDLFARTFHMP